jgi:hypothetical protein
MTSKTTGSMPVKIMIEPTVMLLLLSFRDHVGRQGQAPGTKVELVSTEHVR